MLGIDFPELVVIAVVALIVIGPEHLPKVARTIGHLWGRAQRYVNTVKADISRDMALDELRQMQQKAQQEVSGVQQTMTEAAHEWEQQVKEFESDTTHIAQEIAEQAIPRHEIIEERPAEIPAAPEQKKTVNT